MSCARYRAQLSRYLDDELTPRQRSELLGHVATCPGCAAALARFRQSEVLLKKLPETQPSDEVRGAVLRAAHRQRRTPHGARGYLGWGLSLGGRVHPIVSLGLLMLAVGSGLGALAAPSVPAWEQRLGFGPLPTPTSSYLDVPASRTPPPGSVLAPRLVSSIPFDGQHDVAVRDPLTVRFDQAMDRRSVEHAFRLDPPAPGSFLWDADNELRFTPGSLGLLRGVTYTVALSDGVRSLGGAALPPGPLWSFVTLGPPIVQAADPPAAAMDLPPTTTLTLTFSQPMDTASVDKALSLHGVSGPGTPWLLHGSSNWSDDGRILRYTPAAPLPAGAVDVQLDPGAQDRLGGELAPTRWSFTVAAPPNMVTLGGPRLLLAALNGGRVTPVVTYAAVGGSEERPLAHVNFALYSLSRERFIALVPWLLADSSAPAAGPWPPLDPTGLPLVRTWTGGGAGSGDRSPTGMQPQTSLPVREPGYYLLTADAPGAASDQRVVVVSEAGAAIVAAGDQWLVWSGDLAGAPPVGRAHVRLLAADGTTLVAGDAGNDGLFSAAVPAGTTPALALVEQGGAPAVTLVNAAATTPDGAALAATVITDRPVYQPGDPVNFTAVVPGAVGQASATLDVRLRDPARRVLSALVLKPDNLGVVVGSFTLAAGLTDGNYSLDLTLGDAVYHQLVPVRAASLPPSLSMQLVTPLTGPLFAGDVYTPTLLVRDATGAPVPGAVVTLTLTGAAPSSPLTATTNLQGLVRLGALLPAPVANDVPVVLAATATDAAGHTAQTQAPLVVHTGRLDLHLTLSGQAFAPGDSVAANVAVTDLDGHPLTGQPVSLGLYIPDLVNGQADALNTQPGVSDAQGQFTSTLPLPLQGNFLVRAVTTDTLGAVIRVEQPLWVYAAASPAAWAVPSLPADGLIITPDQTAYTPGALTHLLVQSGASGPLLVLTTLNGSPASQQIVTLDTNGGVVVVPVPDSARDGATLVVTFLRFVPGGSGPHLVRKAIALPITQDATHLRVDLQLDQPDAAYSPGGSILVHVRLRDSLGKPLVGQAVLALAPATAAPMRPPAPDGASLLGSTWPVLAPPPAAADPPFSPDAAPPAYWNAALLTDASGQASVTLPVPDGAAAWQLQAWGFGPGGAAGQATAALTVQSALDLQWRPPTTLVQGDTVQVRVQARNVSTDTLSADIRLKTEGVGLAVDGGDLQTVTLGPDEVRSLDWTLRAVGPGSGRLVLEAGWGQPGGPAAGLLQRAAAATVTAYGVTADTTRAGVLNGNETLTFTLPADTLPAQATLDVRCDPTLGGMLVDSLTTLLAAGPGQGAVSDIAARLAAGVALGDLVQAGRLSADSLPDNLAMSRALDLQALYAAQNADGSWGVVSGAPGDLQTTAAVLAALWRMTNAQSQGGAENAGALDAATLQRGVAWLQAAAAPAIRLPGLPAAPAADSTLTARAQAAYVLSLYGAADRDQTRALIAAGPDLDLAARGWLALALDRLGSHEEAQTLIAGMTLPGNATGPAGTKVAGAPGATALDGSIALQALLALNPGSDADALAAQIVPWLVGQRQGATWAGPAATAAAVQALAGWAAHGAAVSSTSALYRVLVNGQMIKEVALAPRETGGALRLQVPGTILHTGDNQVQLVAEGDVTLYYSLRLTVLQAAVAHPIPSDQAPGVTARLAREIAPAGIGDGQVGATTRITLTLALPEAVPGFQVDAALPGALAPTGAPQVARVDAALPGDPAPLLQGAQADAGVLRVWLGPLAAGTYRLSYEARITQAGSFQLLPAVGAPSDAPQQWTRSAGGSLTFTP